MELPKFEIQSDSGPTIKVVDLYGDESTEISDVEEQPKPNPRYEYVGEYNVHSHPSYKPSKIYRDLKWHMAYDKQVAKYPKIFKPRASIAG